MKATNKDGKRNATVTKRVVDMRDKQSLSWTKIKLALREGKNPIVVSGSTVRRIYDEGHGRKGAHNDSRPLTGGRYKGDKRPETTASKPAAETSKNPPANRRKGPAKVSETAKATAAAKAKRTPRKAAPSRATAYAKKVAAEVAASKATPPTAESTTDKPAEDQATSQAS